MHWQITSWSTIYSLTKQFWFRSGSSTQEAILAATRDWHETMENRASAVHAFSDLSKAFYSLPHSLIQDMLARVGIMWCTVQLVHELPFLPQCVALYGVTLAHCLFSQSVDPLTQLSFINTGVNEMYENDIVFYKPIHYNDDLITLLSDACLITGEVKWPDSTIKTTTKRLLIFRKCQLPMYIISEHWWQPDRSGAFLPLLWSYHHGRAAWVDPSISQICCKAEVPMAFLSEISQTLRYLYWSKLYLWDFFS